MVPTNQLLRAAIYLRVSSPGQLNTDYDPEGYSIPGQREACHRRSELLGAEVVAEYTEYALTGRNTRRPELQRMLAELKDLKVDYVIIYDLSRLARNRLDDAILLLQIEQTGARLVSVLENIDKTPAGRLTHGVLAAVNEYRSAADAEKVHMGMQRKHEQGGTNGPATIGYCNAREIIDGREVRMVVVDQERKRLMQLAFSAFATNEYSIRTLLDLVTKAGLRSRATPKYPSKPLSSSQMHRVLRNDYYIGIVTMGESKRPGRHEPIIDRATFDRVQQVLTAHNKKRARTQKHHHYLRDSIYCEHCQQYLFYSCSRGRLGGLYPYFSCNGYRQHVCPTPHVVHVARVEQGIEQYYGRVSLTVHQRQVIGILINATADALTRTCNQEVAYQTKRLHRLEREQQKLLELHYYGDIAKEVVTSEQQRIKQERRETQAWINRAKDNAKEASQAITEAHRLLTRLKAAYTTASPHIRRLMNQALFTQLLVAHDPIKKNKSHVRVTGNRRQELATEQLAEALLSVGQGIVASKLGMRSHMEDHWKAQAALLIHARNEQKRQADDQSLDIT